MEILSVDALTYTLPEHDEPLLKDISFSLSKGEFVLLSGESGSGKSTLLKCLNGVIPHFWLGTISGDVKLHGHSLQSFSPVELMAQIGTVWQDVDAQVLHLTVEDELVFGMENLGIPVADMEERLQQLREIVQVDLGAVVEHLSGGQKQRLAIAAVLATLPDIILLDEPLANLDTQSAVRMLHWLKQLTEQGKTVVVAEHRLDLASSHADRLLYLKDGVLQHDWKEPQDILNEESRRRLRAVVSSQDRPEEPAAAAIELRGVSYRFGHEPVVRDLSLFVQQGERVVILGENGSGKSTLMKVLAGLCRGRRLDFEVFDLLGQSHSSRDRSFHRNRVGLVFQNPNHQLFMESVYQEVALGSGDGERAEHFLELFGLMKLREQHPLTLSQGQKRLLATAAVAAAERPILLLDEPTIGQDYEHLHNLINVMYRLNEEHGTTIVTVTHDQQAAYALADRVLIMGNGQIVEEGAPDLVNQYFQRVVQMS